MKFTLSVAFMVAFLGVLVSVPARGGEVEASTGVICHTQRQMERFVALNDADPQSAIAAVNAEENGKACSVASLAFRRGRIATTVRSKSAAFQIVDILVVGVVTERGVDAVGPAVYFALFRIEERVAQSRPRERAPQRIL
jgi:hypothetical protein